MTQREQTRPLRGLMAVTALLLAAACPAAGTEFHVIPYDVDPPIQVDGDLGDWAQVPNAIELNDTRQATWGRAEHKGLDDLSGVVRIAWRPAGLAFAADVIDDQFTQPYSGADLFRGDHANLFIDLTPQLEPERNALGRGQYHLAVSPGDLADADSGERPTPPEVFFYAPEEGMPHHGRCQAAAARTARGYVVEAFIPFELLGNFQARQGKDVNFTVALSDGDGTPPSQDTFMTPTTTPWVYGRKMLVPMVLGDGNGRGAPPARSVALTQQEVVIPAQRSHTLTVELPPLPEDKSPYLFFRGRVHRDQVAGWVARAMKVDVNGAVVGGARITNRPQVSTMMRGDVDTYITDAGPFVLWYTPSFDAVQEHPHYKLIDGVKACEFEFDLNGLVRPGRNTVTFHNLAQDLPDASRTATIDDVELRIKSAAPAVALEPAPTGEVLVCEPTPPGKGWDNVSPAGTDLDVQARDDSFRITSRFSTPDGRWNTGSNTHYRHERRILERREWIEVHDTFTNLTDRNLPIMQEHACRLDDRMEKLWLSCVWMPSKQGRKTDGGNPSVYATTAGAGLGMLALNDELRVHSSVAADGSAITLADRQFVLPPKAAYTAEWAVVPTRTPDIWAFVNKARRGLDTNFTIGMTFAFMMGPDPVYSWTDERFRSFIDGKDANFVVQSIYGPPAARWKGRNPYSTAFAKVDHGYYRDFHRRLRSFYPERQVRHGIYYHCFIDNYDGNEVRFVDARKLGPDGEHLNYGGNYRYDRLYVPTLDNAFGRETARNIDIILDDIGADGIFWDEFCTSRGAYTYGTWDGCSADIDARTFTIQRLKGSVALLSRDWRLEQVRRIQARGWLICSGAPQTRTLARTKYLAFCETGSISNCRGMLLWTPLGLGDHLTERTQRDAYRQMLRQLDHGCLYAWYATQIIPSRKTLTEHMFPFTPIELHPGYVIGEERILTNRSGLFGWGDSSAFEAYVFDRDGRQTHEIEVPRVERAGKAYAEVRIAEGYSVAIVRREQ